MTVLRGLDSLLERTKQDVLDMKVSLDKARITNQDEALRHAAGQLTRQRTLYGRVPRQATLEGGFASKENLTRQKRLVSAMCASPNGAGSPCPDMVRSSWVYRKLKRFRAGIESVIAA